MTKRQAKKLRTGSRVELRGSAHLGVATVLCISWPERGRGFAQTPLFYIEFDGDDLVPCVKRQRVDHVRLIDARRDAD